MKLLVPVSYFFGKPRSEIWQLDTENNVKKLICSLPSSNKEVRGKGITGLSWLDNDYLVACDFNRLIKLEYDSWNVVEVVEDSEFNDLHHLSVSKNRIYLANTGRDSIDVFDDRLNMIQRIDGLSEQEWKQRVTGDYEVSGPYFDSPCSGLPFHSRRGPDKWHFNHVFKAGEGLEERIIATSFGARAMMDPETLEVISSKLPVQPHDGFVHGDYLWVTTVSGTIYRAAINQPLVFEPVVDLFAYAPHQGWCRGMYISGDKLFVGITAIYEKSNRTRWLKGAIEDSRSGIYKISLSSLQIEAFYDFSTAEGSRIFSIVPDLQGNP
ncbi:hypothetical protein [Spongorhabdus nitratireducens]